MMVDEARSVAIATARCLVALLALAEFRLRLGRVVALLAPLLAALRAFLLLLLAPALRLLAAELLHVLALLGLALRTLLARVVFLRAALHRVFLFLLPAL